jgi:ergothioneine biosynthesis protein EgtB
MSTDVRERLLALFTETRTRTESLAARLSPEDQQLQSMPDASPTKWHRAHTTWFFETFVLEPAGVPLVDARYGALFNSYYEAMGPRVARGSRGLLSRPSAAEVGEYRRRVDRSTANLLLEARPAELARQRPILELGIAHEEQHQELLLTDILNAFSSSPLSPAFLPAGGGSLPRSPRSPGAMRFVPFDGGLREIGAAHAEPFTFDNERPRHKVWVEPFELADRLVTAGELKAFIREGGYSNPSLWLSEGFDFVRSHGLTAPLYCRFEDGELHAFSLLGPRVVEDDEPVTHVSYYEADALARFLGARLPSEAEWELAASNEPVCGTCLDDLTLRPRPAGASPTSASGVRQLLGDAWEWTRSAYEPYPGYVTPPGALGEYNGKFMVNQQVLRGGSCLTPRRHIRATYRNFWPASTRFQMTGVRLAREVAS